MISGCRWHCFRQEPANDFAYYFDIPSSIEYQLDIALGTTTSPTDVGVVNDRNFVNVAAMGALIDVSQKTDPNLKNVMGTLAYYLKAVTELPQLRALPVTLTTPDEVMEEEIYFMVVMNGESAGGFLEIFAAIVYQRWEAGRDRLP